MSAIARASRPATSNRRRTVRQSLHAPACASFGDASGKEMLDLYEILDISEDGVAVQCPSPMKINQQVELCLDYPESTEQLSATTRVVWSDSAGRTGLEFSSLNDSALHRVREWLFLYALAGTADAVSSLATPSAITEQSALRPNNTGNLTAASELQKEAEALGPDLEAVLSLIALRAYSLLQASGAAIALAGNDARFMTCGASAGQSAPPVGATLQVGSGFSGECVRIGTTLRCDDTETDERVDRQSCHALGIRSALAVPVRSDAKTIGLIEVFSERPGAFSENDSAMLQRFTETITGAVNRTRSSYQPSDPPPFANHFSSGLDILFPDKPEEREKNVFGDEDKLGAIHHPRAHLLLFCVAATIALALGFVLALRIQQKRQARHRNGEKVVLGSSASRVEGLKSDPSLDSSEIEQLRELAKRGNPAAENAMGLLYTRGDEKHAIKQDQNEAVRWFTKAAEDGSVPAQYKMGLLYWGGHGVPKDASKAYFWAVLARAGGQEGSEDLTKVLADSMTRAQAAAIEHQAQIWFQHRQAQGKRPE